MKISPWTVASWPKVEWYLPTSSRAWPHFDIGGVCLDRASTPGAATGTIAWVAEVNGADVGLAWDWIEVLPSVVAFRDPNGIISNLRFLLDEHHYEPHLAAVRSLVRLTSRLGWQRPVVAALKAARQAAPVARGRSLSGPAHRAQIHSPEASSALARKPLHQESLATRW